MIYIFILLHITYALHWLDLSIQLKNFPEKNTEILLISLSIIIQNFPEKNHRKFTNQLINQQGGKCVVICQKPICRAKPITGAKFLTSKIM